MNERMYGQWRMWCMPLARAHRPTKEDSAWRLLQVNGNVFPRQRSRTPREKSLQWRAKRERQTSALSNLSRAVHSVADCAANDGTLAHHSPGFYPIRGICMCKADWPGRIWCYPAKALDYFRDGCFIQPRTNLCQSSPRLLLEVIVQMDSGGANRLYFCQSWMSVANQVKWSILFDCTRRIGAFINKQP